MLISEVDRNNKIASDRVIIENMFGRVAKMFGMFGRTKFTWSRDRFDTAIDVMFSLANFHVRLHPLRQQDQDYWDLVLSKIRVRAERVKNSGKNRMKKYRDNQRQMQDAFEANDDEAEIFGQELCLNDSENLIFEDNSPVDNVLVEEENDREDDNGDWEVPVGNFGFDHEDNGNMSEDLMMDINDALNKANEGSACVGDNQDNDSDTREYIPVRKEIRKFIESSDSDDNSLFEIDIPIKKKPVLTKKTASKKKRVRRKPKAKY